MKPCCTWLCYSPPLGKRWLFVSVAFRSMFSQLSLSVLSPSAPGGHLECDRSLAGKRPEQPGPQHRTERGSPGSCDFNHLLPAQQADADDPSDQRGAIHQLAAQLPARGLWSVSLPSFPSSPNWWKDFTSSRKISGKQLSRLHSVPNNEHVNSAN